MLESLRRNTQNSRYIKEGILNYVSGKRWPITASNIYVSNR